MRFQVPKFLEREAHIVGPLTFKGLGFLAAIGGGLLFLFFALPRALFVLCFFVIGGGATALVLVKIEGVPLFRLVIRSFGFFTQPKTYIWRRKQIFAPIKLATKKKEKEEKEMAVLRAAPGGKLDELKSKIDLGK